jgi:site-specific DNA recombinase
LNVPTQRYPLLHQACAELSTPTISAQRAAIAKLVERVQVMDARIEIRCGTQAIASVLDLPCHPDAPETITLTSEARLTRTGRALRLVHDDGSITAPAADQSLARLLPLARRWWSELRQGEVNIKQLAAREQLSSSWVTRVVRLAFLSPEVVEAALTGGLRAGTDGTKLMLGEPMSPSWREQAATLLTRRGAAAQLR